MFKKKSTVSNDTVHVTSKHLLNVVLFGKIDTKPLHKKIEKERERGNDRDSKEKKKWRFLIAEN